MSGRSVKPNMNTKVEDGAYNQPEPTTMTSILVIEYTDQERMPSPPSQILPAGTRLELIGTGPKRHVFYVHGHGQMDSSDILLKVWGCFQPGVLARANFLPLSDLPYSVRGTIEQPLVERYSIPAPQP